MRLIGQCQSSSVFIFRYLIEDLKALRFVLNSFLGITRLAKRSYNLLAAFCLSA